MPKFTLLEVPRQSAFNYARSTHKATAMDPGYQVKSVLADSGEPVRPWRFMPSEPDLYVLLGVETGTLNTNARGHNLRAVKSIEWTPKTGETVSFDLHVSPSLQRRVGPDGDQHTETFDAAYGASDRAAAYRDWVLKTMRAERTGLCIDGDVEITQIRDNRAPRKFPTACGRRVAKQIVFPSCRARFMARIEDASLAAEAVEQGIWKQKAFGFGTLFPKSVMDEAGAAYA